MSNIENIWDSLGTAWAELSEDDRAKIEDMWGTIDSISQDLYKEIYQRKFNNSFLTALPFFIESGKYIKLFSDSEKSLELLGINTLTQQKLNYNLIYCSGLYGTDQNFSFNGLEYSNSNEYDEPLPLEDGVYVLGINGFVSSTNYWEEDTLAGTY